jgi:Reverse transcriptase (RNA-dependent DNA polymerase)
MLFILMLDVSKQNLVSIFLFPQKQDAKLITQFKSINLTDCNFMIITKLLSSRLVLCMNSIISFTQTAYTKERNIMNNVVIASEVLHQVKVKKIKCVFFKINFEKIFDRVNWNS